MKLLGIISVDFHITDQLLIIYCTVTNYMRKSGNTMASASAIYSSSRNPIIQLGGKFFYDILSEPVVCMKPIGLMKTCLN